MKSNDSAGESQVRPKTGSRSAFPNAVLDVASASALATAPEDLELEFQRRLAAARRREEVERIRNDYTRHTMQWSQFDELTAIVEQALEQAQAHAGGELELSRALSDAEIDQVLCAEFTPPGERRSLGCQPLRQLTAQLMARLIRNYSAAIGCELVITSRSIIRRELKRQFGLKVSLKTIDRARPLLAFVGTPLFEITRDNSNTTRGLATICRGLPARAVRKLALPVSPEVVAAEARKPQAESLFVDDVTNPQGLTAHRKQYIYTNPVGTREQTPDQADAQPRQPTKAPGGQRIPGDWRIQDETLPRRIGIQIFEEFWRRQEVLGHPKVSYRRHAPQFVAAVEALARYLGREAAIRFVYNLIERAAAADELVPHRAFRQPQSLMALLPIVRHETRRHRRRARRDRDARIFAGYDLPDLRERLAFEAALGDLGAGRLRLAGFAKRDCGPDGRLRKPRVDDSRFWSANAPRRRVAVLSGDFTAWQRLRYEPAFLARVLEACSQVGAVVFCVTGERELFLTDVLRELGMLEPRPGQRDWRGEVGEFHFKRLLTEHASEGSSLMIEVAGVDFAGRNVSLRASSTTALRWIEQSSTELLELVHLVWGDQMTYDVCDARGYALARH